jgi:hypothetical protein
MSEKVLQLVRYYYVTSPSWKKLDGVIEGYDGLSPVDSFSIYRLYNMLERGQWVYSLSPKGPAPTQGVQTT